MNTDEHRWNREETESFAGREVGCRAWLLRTLFDMIYKIDKIFNASIFRINNLVHHVRTESALRLDADGRIGVFFPISREVGLGWQ